MPRSGGLAAGGTETVSFERMEGFLCVEGNLGRSPGPFLGGAKADTMTHDPVSFQTLVLKQSSGKLS